MNQFSILIDLDRLKDVNTGLGHVAVEFGKAIAKIKDSSFKFTFLVPKKFDGYFGNTIDYEIISLKRRYFPTLCKKYDLWYTIHQDSFYFPSDKETPYIITINDLNFLGEKSTNKAKLRLKRLQKKIDRASAITVISKFTETEVRQNLNVENVPVHVIYCGVDVKIFEKVDRPVFVPSGNLLFSIGVVQPKKNYMVLIDFMQRLPNYSLIIAGNKNSEFAVLLQQRINELGLQNRIILPGLISDEDKYWMYQNCKAVLFPSKFEGMGFPPVEAMRFGKPVFASTFSSIPEVSEDKAYYWENFDPDYMSKLFLEKMAEFNSDKNRPEILRKHSLKYLWDENASMYLSLFKQILTSPKS
jgi:glycosyltransferase involved in cell wall biosynthesis